MAKKPKRTAADVLADVPEPKKWDWRDELRAASGEIADDVEIVVDGWARNDPAVRGKLATKIKLARWLHGQFDKAGVRKGFSTVRGYVDAIENS